MCRGGLPGFGAVLGWRPARGWGGCAGRGRDSGPGGCAGAGLQGLAAVCPGGVLAGAGVFSRAAARKTFFQKALRACTRKRKGPVPKALVIGCNS